MLEIPQQFLHVTEPPYKLAMDGRMPIFSTNYDNARAYSSSGLSSNLGIPLTGIFSTSHIGLVQNVPPKVNLSSTNISTGIIDRSDKLPCVLFSLEYYQSKLFYPLSWFLST